MSVRQLRKILLDQAQARLLTEVVAHVDDHADVLVFVVDACHVVTEDAVHLFLDLLPEGPHLSVHAFIEVMDMLAGVDLGQMFLVALYLRIYN